ncbi:hypothetical protein [Cohnella hongkongensis]|uniref:Heparinase II/III-like protein n=1 Tax=Cohnella hongkongensis TaxID=178337 RepID=A0ABV9FBQ8_9BACL
MNWIERSAEELYYPAGESADQFWARAANAPEFAGLAAEVRAEGERLCGEPIPKLTEELFAIFARTGSRLEYERAYFQRRRRLNAFALLSLLEPDEQRYGDKLLETIRAVLDERTWCLPAHVMGADAAKTIDLFSSETGFTLSEIACLLGDRLPPELTEAIDRAVSERLIEPLLRHGPHHWETARHNWASVCAGSIGAAALLRTKDEKTLNAVLAKALPALDRYLEGFGEDGACPEGLGYWNYGFGYYVMFADLLRKRTGGRIDLLSKPKIRSIALFQQAAYLCGNRVACFSDSPQTLPFRVGLTRYLARLYPEIEVPDERYGAGFADDHCHRWAPVFRDWIWRTPRPEKVGLRPSSRYFPNAQWLLSRHRTEAGRCFGFAAKGGHNAEPHNHNDVGQFIWTVDGTAFAADLGSGEYTAAYFGEGRYEYDCNGSQGHSVPIVNGCGQTEGRDRAAIVLAASADEREDRLRLEIGRAYRAPGLKSLVRELSWNKTGRCRLTLTDEVVFDGEPVSLTERVVTFVRPDLKNEGVVRLAAGSGLTALIRYDRDGLEATAERRVYSDHDGAGKEWFAIDWKVRRPERTNRIELIFELESEG